MWHVRGRREMHSVLLGKLEREIPWKNEAQMGGYY
jgi:hypothetical protein